MKARVYNDDRTTWSRELDRLFEAFKRFPGHDPMLGYVDVALGVVQRFEHEAQALSGKSAPKRSKSNGKLGKLEALYIEALRELFPNVVRLFELHGSYVRAACKRQRADVIDALEALLMKALDGSIPANVFSTIADHCVISTREERSRMMLPGAAHAVVMKALRDLRGASCSVRATEALPATEREEERIRDRVTAAPMTGKSAPGRNLASRVQALSTEARSRIREALTPFRDASARTLRRKLLPILRAEEQALSTLSTELVAVS